MRKIYIDLDTLFDTRLGLLSQIDRVAAEAVLASNDYWDREHTNWTRLTDGRVTDEVFEARWLQRDKSVVQASIVTGIIPVLINILTEYHAAKREGVAEYDITLEVNVWPYDLDDEEMDVLTQILQQDIFYDGLVVTYSSIPLEELTPAYINDTYSAMLLFEFHRWIKQHCEVITQTRCRGLNIVVPKLFEHDPGKLPVDRKKEEILSFKLWLMEYLTLEFIDARWFSLFRPEVAKRG